VLSTHAYGRRVGYYVSDYRLNDNDNDNDNNNNNNKATIRAARAKTNIYPRLYGFLDAIDRLKMDKKQFIILL
jgi:hypothetical protein